MASVVSGKASDVRRRITRAFSVSVDLQKNMEMKRSFKGSQRSSLLCSNCPYRNTCRRTLNIEGGRQQKTE